jgi:hypothetical protein
MSPLLNMPQGRGLGRLAGRRMGLRGRQARMLGLMNAHLRGLSDSYVSADWSNPDQPTLITSPVVTVSPGYTGGGISSGGGLTPTEASLISQGISTAGAIGVRAVSPTPTLTYGPNGTIIATGGATVPTSLIASTTLTEYLPYLIGGGLLFLLVSVMGRR